MPAAIGLGGALGFWGTQRTNSAAAAEAQRNRDFQERMSNTAHQRQRADLRKAGLNPMLGMKMDGASSPAGSMAPVENAGEGASRGIATALQVAQARANINLTEAQTAAANAQGQLANAQAGDITNKWFGGGKDLLEMERELRRMTIDQQRELFPYLRDKAMEEAQLAKHSARATEFLADLRRAELAGASNIEKFEKEWGEKGPWMRMFMEVLRTLAPYQKPLPR